MNQVKDEEIQSIVREYNETRLTEARGHLCHAPFVSMNFDQSGDVTVCCFNRSFVIGRYPQNSVDEIWRSPRFHELRQAITDLDLGKGCGMCREQLISRNFYSTLARNYDRLQVNGNEAAATGPRILEFELSNVCNLECVMCNGHFSSLIRKNREKLPPINNPYDDTFIEQLKPFWTTVEWAKFLGGEPFLNALYFKIWRQIVSQNPQTKVVITTNATVFNQNVEWVLDHVKPFLVLSIDSMQKQTYEKIRVNASFERTQENLSRFLVYRKEKERTLDLSICPMIYNWQEIPEIFNWGTEHSICVNLNTVTWPRELSLQNLGSQKIREIIREYRSLRLKTWQDFAADPPIWSQQVSERNHNAFTGFIHQLEFWAGEPIANEAGTTLLGR